MDRFTSRKRDHLQSLTPTTDPRKPMRSHRSIGAEVVLFGIIAFVIALIRTKADIWPSATLLAYGPRWAWLVPPIAWTVFVLFRHRRIAWLSVATSAVAVIFLLGFNIPRVLFAPPLGAESQTVRIITCNVNGARTDGTRFDEARFVRWIDSVKPDIVALQEWTPNASLAELQKRLPFVDHESELWVASRYPLRRIGFWNSPAFDGAGFILGVEVEAARPFPVYIVHLETPRLGVDITGKSWDENYAKLKSNLNLRRRVAADAREWLLNAGGPSLIVGDFNTVQESPLYAQNWSTFGNAFDEAGLRFGNTKIATWWGARIDHILHEANWQAARCWVGPDVGSDHFPLAADLDH